MVDQLRLQDTLDTIQLNFSDGNDYIDNEVDSEYWLSYGAFNPLFDNYLESEYTDELTEDI